MNLAGEPLAPALVDRLYAAGVERVFDLYGPSEDTTYTTCALRRRNGPATIGRPVGNEQVYILDRRDQPVPPGVTGELCIGGKGLARGYRNDPRATAQKFTPDAFSGEPGARLYRTGDLARFRADGEIEFLGRADAQIKLRGHRIEPGEIEDRHAVLRRGSRGRRRGMGARDGPGQAGRVPGPRARKGRRRRRAARVDGRTPAALHGARHPDGARVIAADSQRQARSRGAPGADRAERPAVAVRGPARADRGGAHGPVA